MIKEDKPRNRNRIEKAQSNIYNNVQQFSGQGSTLEHEVDYVIDYETQKELE